MCSSRTSGAWSSGAGEGDVTDGDFLGAGPLAIGRFPFDAGLPEKTVDGSHAEKVGEELGDPPLGDGGVEVADAADHGADELFLGEGLGGDGEVGAGEIEEGEDAAITERELVLEGFDDGGG